MEMVYFDNETAERTNIAVLLFLRRANATRVTNDVIIEYSRVIISTKQIHESFQHSLKCNLWTAEFHLGDYSLNGLIIVTDCLSFPLVADPEHVG